MSTKFLKKTALILGLLAMTACADLDPTEQRMLTGAAVGTAAGAAGTAIFGGCVACGAAVGGALGAGTGYVMSQIQGQNQPAPK